MAKILVVDDSKIMRVKIKSVLEELNHTIVGEADDGKKAIEEYERLLPDIVTMDITMPVMNGIDTIISIKNKHKDANIIIVSALSQKKMVLQGLNNGARNYVLKPITKEKMEKALSKILDFVNFKNEKLEEKEEIKEENLMVPAYKVENKSGIFYISINKNLNKNNMDLLKGTVQSFLVISPLNIVFKVNCDNLERGQLEEIKLLMQKITESGGVTDLEY